MNTTKWKVYGVRKYELMITFVFKLSYLIVMLKLLFFLFW